MRLNLELDCPTCNSQDITITYVIFMYLSVDHIDVRTYQLTDGHPFSKSISEGEQAKPDITRHEMFLSIYVIAETCPYRVGIDHKHDTNVRHIILYTRIKVKVITFFIVKL